MPSRSKTKSAPSKVGYRNPPVQAQFKKGQSGNPAGRSRRPRSLTEALLEDFLASWERHGVSVLERVAKRDPAAFITAAVALVPITAPLPLPSPASRSKRAPAPGRRPARRARHGHHGPRPGPRGPRGRLQPSSRRSWKAVVSCSVSLASRWTPHTTSSPDSPASSPPFSVARPSWPRSSCSPFSNPAAALRHARALRA